MVLGFRGIGILKLYTNARCRYSSFIHIFEPKAGIEPATYSFAIYLFLHTALKEG